MPRDHLEPQKVVRVESAEEYDDLVFSWRGNGLIPARKRRLASTPV